MEAKSGDESKAIVVNKERLFDYAPDYYRKLLPSEIGDIISKYAWDDPNDFEKWLERVEPVFRVMYGLKERLAVNVERNAMTGFSLKVTEDNGKYFQYPLRDGGPNQVIVDYNLTISEYVEAIKVGLKFLNDCVDRKIEYDIKVDLDFELWYIYFSDLEEISNSTGITWEDKEEGYGPNWSIHENEELRLTIVCTFWEDPRGGR
jgi:hypothetical protein